MSMKWVGGLKHMKLTGTHLKYQQDQLSGPKRAYIRVELHAYDL
jgi:hypothetical protein